MFGETTDSQSVAVMSLPWPTHWNPSFCTRPFFVSPLCPYSTPSRCRMPFVNAHLASWQTGPGADSCHTAIRRAMADPDGAAQSTQERGIDSSSSSSSNLVHGTAPRVPSAWAVIVSDATPRPRQAPSWCDAVQCHRRAPTIEPNARVDDLETHTHTHSDADADLEAHWRTRWRTLTKPISDGITGSKSTGASVLLAPASAASPSTEPRAASARVVGRNSILQLILLFHPHFSIVAAAAAA